MADCNGFVGVRRRRRTTEKDELGSGGVGGTQNLNSDCVVRLNQVEHRVEQGAV